MPLKQKIRYAVDLLMTLEMIALMSFAATGEAVHEWIGVSVLLLFCVHLYLNGNWFRSLLRGSYTPYRVLQTALVVMLLVVMTAQAVSGIAMSSHAVPFIKLPLNSSDARAIHLCCAYWSFVTISLHLGIHWSIFLGLVRRARGGKAFSSSEIGLMRFASLCLCIWGIYCFVSQGMADYILLRSEFAFFDYDKPVLLALGENASVMALWATAGFLLQKWTVRLNSNSARRKGLS